jgi:hypothetical protein
MFIRETFMPCLTVAIKERFTTHIDISCPRHQILPYNVYHLDVVLNSGLLVPGLTTNY